MKLLIRIQYSLAILFFATGASLFLFNKYRHLEPPQLLTNNEFVPGANSIQDIEHLRKLLFTVINAYDKALVADSAAINATVSVAVFVCVMAAAALLACAFQVRKIGKSSGE